MLYGNLIYVGATLFFRHKCLGREEDLLKPYAEHHCMQLKLQWFISWKKTNTVTGINYLCADMTQLACVEQLQKQLTKKRRDTITPNHVTVINDICILTLSVPGSWSSTLQMKRGDLAKLHPWLLSLYWRSPKGGFRWNVFQRGACSFPLHTYPFRHRWARSLNNFRLLGPAQ